MSLSGPIQRNFCSINGDKFIHSTGSESLVSFRLTTNDCATLIRLDGRLTRPDKQGKVAATEPPILCKPGLIYSQWHHQMLGINTGYWRAIGSAHSLI